MSLSPPPVPVAPVARSIDVQDPRALRALAHPLRGRLLGLLRLDGPSTATQLGYRLGESSGSTSYHLRQLAAYGFVEDMPGEGNGRERWWRALHRSTHWETTDFVGDPAAREVVDELLLQQVDQRRRTLAAYIDQRRGRGNGWEPAGSLNDYAMRMRPEDAVAMAAELTAVLARWSDASEPPSSEPHTDGESDTGLVLVHLDVLPLSEYPL
jgi:DNA-binding transcriptional ArsR family regulator